MHFSAISGHQAAKRLLMGEVATGRLAPFYMLVGPEGVGKSLLARAFGRSLLCQVDRTDDCACRACRLYAAGNHPDVLVVGEAAAAELKLEEALRARDFLRVKPYLGGRRFVLMLDADRLNPAAQNALLKTLEEPPENTVLFFSSARPEAFLETVRSRARIIRTGALSKETCALVLAGLGADAKEAGFLAETAAGSPGRALSFRQVAGSVREAADALVKSLDAGGSAYEVAQPLIARLADFETPAERRLFMSAATTVLCGIYRKRLAPQGSEPLGTIISALTETYRATFQNLRPEAVAHVLALRLWRAQRGEVSELCGVYM